MLSGLKQKFILKHKKEKEDSTPPVSFVKQHSHAVTAPENNGYPREKKEPYKLERWVEITTNIGCQNRCLYCPQDSLIKSYMSGAGRPHMMSLETFKAILYHIPKHLDICFTGMSEPLSNPQCMDMLRYSCQAGFRTHLYTTFRDSSLDMISQLGELPIVTYVIHLPDADGLMNIRVDEEYLRVLSAFQRLDLPDVTYMTIGNLHEDIKRIMQYPVNASPVNLRAGHLGTDVEERLKAANVPYYSKTSDPFPNDRAVICDRRTLYPWGDTAPTHPECGIVLPDGSLVLCCMDWGMQHCLGNLCQDNYENIMHGSVMRRIEDSMLCKNQDPILCRQCEYAREAE